MIWIDGNAKEGMLFAVGNWVALLNLARMYGWQPGPGEYTTNDGRKITAAEAGRIAKALQRALPDLSQDNPPLWVRGPRRTYSGAYRDKVVQFIALCRRGGFTIN